MSFSVITRHSLTSKCPRPNDKYQTVQDSTLRLSLGTSQQHHLTINNWATSAASC